MKVNIVDLVAAIIILWELLMGLRRGLSGELFRLIGTCLVFSIGLRFYEDFGLMVANHSRLGQNQEMAFALAFLLILVGMGVCFFILRIVLTLLVNVKFNDAIDRPAGGLAGFLNGGLIAALLVFAAGLWPNTELQPLIKIDSYVGKTVFQVVPIVKEKIRSLAIRFPSSPSRPEPGPDSFRLFPKRQSEPVPSQDEESFRVNKNSRHSVGRQMPRQNDTEMSHEDGNQEAGSKVSE